MMENNVDYKKLEKYWNKHGSKVNYSERLAMKFSVAFNNERQWKETYLLDLVRGCQMLLCSIFSLCFGQIENGRKRRHLSKILNLQKEEIAVDVNDLIKHKDGIRCYGDDFTYNAATSKQYLKNIEVIFGDAHLEALDDITCLNSLKKVTGMIYYKGESYKMLSEVKNCL